MMGAVLVMTAILQDNSGEQKDAKSASGILLTYRAGMLPALVYQHLVCQAVLVSAARLSPSPTSVAEKSLPAEAEPRAAQKLTSCFPLYRIHFKAHGF